MKKIFASLITIGDELLIGQVIDTNSAWMAQRLNNIGIAVRRRVAIGDDADEIRHALIDEMKYADVVLITGGLGPTSDDITKQFLCEFFSGKMIVDPGALQNVKFLFEKIYHKPISEVIARQAEVPDVCEVLQNKRGSAPGMVFHKDGIIFISMPGVPYEMQGMMDDVIPYLQKSFHLPAIIHKTILTAGIGESAIAEILQDFEKQLPEEIRLAYLPTYGMVRLRLTTWGFDEPITRNLINYHFYQLRGLVKNYMVTDEDETMEKVLGKKLLLRHKTIATAESCTGGSIASLISSVAGSSAYYLGSIISYSCDVKESMLDVKKETLNTDGAVSEETVKEMLSGLLQKIDADFGIAVSGIMGPSGGTDEKPVGTVWVAVGNKEKCVTKKFNHRFDRKKNTEITSVMALNMMRIFILENE